jgi:hypothetical protein
VQKTPELHPHKFQSPLPIRYQYPVPLQMTKGGSIIMVQVEQRGLEAAIRSAGGRPWRIAEGGIVATLGACKR